MLFLVLAVDRVYDFAVDSINVEVQITPGKTDLHRISTKKISRAQLFLEIHIQIDLRQMRLGNRA